MLDADPANTRASVGPHPAAPLPAALAPDLLDMYRRELEQEHRPVGFTENIVLRDLAYRAANMERLKSIEAAMQRQGARAIAEVTRPLAGKEPFSEDVELAGCMTSAKIDELFRLGLGNSRAFYRALGEFRNLKSERMNSRRAAIYDDHRFADEHVCEKYLVQRFQCGNTPCRRCRKAVDGCWIASRRCWECAECKAQIGIRSGTVMERSPLPLAQWFIAIRILLCHPMIDIVELMEFVAITRVPTVRSMAKKIRAAMAAENASQLLAGLEQTVVKHLS